MILQLEQTFLEQRKREEELKHLEQRKTEEDVMEKKRKREQERILEVLSLYFFPSITSPISSLSLFYCFIIIIIALSSSSHDHHQHHHHHHLTFKVVYACVFLCMVAASLLDFA